MSVARSSKVQLECEDYNSFFHPNVCHVCKLKPRGFKLDSCPLCHMISYCCEEHRMLHRLQHKEICDVIVGISKEKNIWNTRYMNLEGWAQFKEANMQCMKQKLRRNLEPYEEQMFLFARSCIICRKQDSLFIGCDKCVSVDLCFDHYLTPYKHNCRELKHSLNFDIYNICHKNDGAIIPSTFLYINKLIIHNMESFIQKKTLHNKDLAPWTYDDYIYTDIFSKPLTLYYGMRDANLLHLLTSRGFFIVHIITGSFFDRLSLLAWEMILHELHPDTKLQIVMIGPELSGKFHTEQICDTCIYEKKELQYEYYSTFYYNFANSLHMRPDVIIGFDAEFKNVETLEKNIKAIQRQRCPLILTFKSVYKAQEIITKIRQILNLPLIPIIDNKNKFSSYRSYRDYENDSVFFPNQHLVIYSDLTNVNIPTQ